MCERETEYEREKEKRDRDRMSARERERKRDTRCSLFLPKKNKNAAIQGGPACWAIDYRRIYYIAVLSFQPFPARMETLTCESLHIFISHYFSAEYIYFFYSNALKKDPLLCCRFLKFLASLLCDPSQSLTRMRLIQVREARSDAIKV